MGCNSNNPSGDGSEGANKSNNSENIDEIEIKKQMVNETKKDEVSAAYYLFPAPGEILRIIDEERLVFNEELLIPVQNLDTYIDSKSQTLHLGGYISDLAYIALFSKHDKALEYINAIHKLSNEADVNIKNINPNHIDKLMASKQFKDSLLNLSNTAFFEMINYLESNDREDAVSMFSVGAFIESIYIAVNLVEKYSIDNKIVTRISKQKAALSNLMAYAEENKEMEKTKYYGIKEIRQIKAIFDNCEFETSGDVADSEHMLIKEEDFYKLKAEITKLRNEIMDL